MADQLKIGVFKAHDWYLWLVIDYLQRQALTKMLADATMDSFWPNMHVILNAAHNDNLLVAVAPNEGQSMKTATGATDVCLLGFCAFSAALGVIDILEVMPGSRRQGVATHLVTAATNITSQKYNHVLRRMRCQALLKSVPFWKNLGWTTSPDAVVTATETLSMVGPEFVQ